MAKGAQKNNSAVKKVANKHLHARVSYLYQAAHLLEDISNKTTVSTKQPSSTQNHAVDKAEPQDSVAASSQKLSLGLSQRMASQIRPIARKAVFKVAPSIKRTICKRCNILLVPGRSSEVHVENRSRGQTKQWADVQVILCTTCGYEKRYPVGAAPQLKKRDRPAVDVPVT